MIIVTKQDMVDFINSQPDDRKVDFDEMYHFNECGCLMVQYGKEKEWDFNICGINCWQKRENVIAEFEKGLLYNYFIPHYKCTYGDIKARLKEKKEVE